MRIAALIRCGEVCKACAGECLDRDDSIRVECPSCKSRGCNHCDQKGHFEVEGCPRKFVGAKLIDAINVAGMCADGLMPAPGGIMDQSSWFIDLWSTLRSEENMIELEKLERKRGSRH